MRNLRNVRYDGWPLPIQFRERSVTAATWDVANDSVLCTIGPSEKDALIELIRVDNTSNPQYQPSLLIWCISLLIGYSGTMRLLHRGTRHAQILICLVTRF
jgi:hypothetical protein